LIREAAASRFRPPGSGSVLPAPFVMNFAEKLLLSVPVPISARFYPGRIFESSAKPCASAFARVSPVWPVLPWTSPRSSLHLPTRRKFARFYPCSSLHIEWRRFSSKSNLFRSVRFYPGLPAGLNSEVRTSHSTRYLGSVWPSPPSRNWLVKFFFPINLCA